MSILIYLDIIKIRGEIETLKGKILEDFNILSNEMSTNELNLVIKMLCHLKYRSRRDIFIDLITRNCKDFHAFMDLYSRLLPYSRSLDRILGILSNVDERDKNMITLYRNKILQVIFAENHNTPNFDLTIKLILKYTNFGEMI